MDKRTYRYLCAGFVAMVLMAAGCSRPAPPAGAAAPPPATPAAAAPNPDPPSPAPSAPAAGGTVVPETPTAPADPPPPAPPDLPGALWVIVENSPGAVPQAGLDRADLVFEVEAEGGITRLLAAFHRHDAQTIGPIRSARFYLLHLVRPYQGPIAHAGGNTDALTMLVQDQSYQDLDEIYNSGGYFYRSTDRQPPHNLYTSTDLLVSGARDKGYTLRPLPNWPTGTPPGGEPAATVHVTFPLDFTKVTYAWADNRYLRTQNGAPHVMADGARLAPRNLVVLYARHDYMVNFAGQDQRDIGVVGAGEGLVFSQGKYWPARWSKPAPEQMLTLTVDDQPLHLPPGQTWITVVPGADHIRFGP